MLSYRTFQSIKLSIYSTEFTQFLGGQPLTTASGKYHNNRTVVLNLVLNVVNVF